MRLPRKTAAVAVILATAALLPAGAPAAVAAGPEPVQTVTVMLASPHPQLLHQLAAGGHRASARDLAAVRPDGARRQQVVAALEQLGLSVTSVGRWSVTARARASRVHAVFGSARAVRPDSWHAHALPRLPAALAHLVTGAFGGDESRPVAHALGMPAVAHPATALDYNTAGLHGDALRSAYDAPTGVLPAGVAAPAIATVQLSGWDADELSVYAGAANLADPVASGQYTAVPVDGADPTVADAGGDAEVALDQQALLAVAPFARQRAYFAPNTPSGFADAIYTVGDDASDATHDGYRLTALSISWGSCEDTSATSADYYNTMEQALSYVVATGVTVFAATGDSGAYDCYDPTTHTGTQLAVDYPASSAWVVGVGGTRLDTSSGTATETAWSGSGGGESKLWARPSWQTAGGSTAKGRLVPDIALVADPTTGFASYNQGEWYTPGGTSLGAPASAAMLTATLADAGYTYGIGDIHPALYQAASSAFRDVTSGSNPGPLPSGGFSAGPGYDEVTGLGTPLWGQLRDQLSADPHVRVGSGYVTTTGRPVPITVSRPQWATYSSWGLSLNPTSDPGCSLTTATSMPQSVTPTDQGWNLLLLTARDAAGTCHESVAVFFVDATPPVLEPPGATLSPPTSQRLRLTWSATDAETSSTMQTQSGLDHYVYTVREDGRNVVSSAVTTGTSAYYPGRPGHTYTLLVRAVDVAGNSSPARAARVTVPIDQTHFEFGPYWGLSAGSYDYGKSISYATQPGAWFRRTATGSAYTLLMRTGPAYGKAAVYVDGTLARVIDTYDRNFRFRVPFSLWHGPLGSHTVEVKVLGQGSGAGTKIVVDGLLAGR